MSEVSIFNETNLAFSQDEVSIVQQISKMQLIIYFSITKKKTNKTLKSILISQKCWNIEHKSVQRNSSIKLLHCSSNLWGKEKVSDPDLGLGLVGDPLVVDDQVVSNHQLVLWIATQQGMMHVLLQYLTFLGCQIIFIVYGSI